MKTEDFGDSIDSETLTKHLQRGDTFGALSSQSSNSMFRKTSNIFAFSMFEQIAEKKSSHTDSLEFLIHIVPNLLLTLGIHKRGQGISDF